MGFLCILQCLVHVCKALEWAGCLVAQLSACKHLQRAAQLGPTAVHLHQREHREGGVCGADLSMSRTPVGCPGCMIKIMTGTQLCAGWELAQPPSTEVERFIYESALLARSRFKTGGNGIHFAENIINLKPLCRQENKPLSHKRHRVLRLPVAPLPAHQVR